MTHINQRLPLRVAPLTPSRIDTADGFSVSVEWRNTDHENPYGDAEEFAAFIVKAVNSHLSLIERCEELEGALRAIAEGNLGDDPWQANYEKIRHVASAYLTKSEAAS